MCVMPSYKHSLLYPTSQQINNTNLKTITNFSSKKKYRPLWHIIACSVVCGLWFDPPGDWTRDL